MKAGSHLIEAINDLWLKVEKCETDKNDRI